MSALPLLEAFDFIAGTRRRTGADDSVWVSDPNDGRRIEAQARSSAATVEEAITTAAAAHEAASWIALGAAGRAEVLEAIASELEARAEAVAYADAATTGVVVRTTRMLAGVVPNVFRGAAQELRKGVLLEELPGQYGPVEVRREARGPAAVIAPWNAPAVIAAHKVASALAAGCPVVLKPSEWAPHSCRWIADAIATVGLPTGVFQLVHGPACVGAALVADSRIAAVSFTGGLAGGRAVARACAEALKPAQLELGGNNPMIVLDDASVDAAVAGIVAGLTTLNGQWCRALGRVLVHASLAERLLARALEALAEVKLGSSLALESTMGPLVHGGHLAHVEAALERLEKAGGARRSSTPLPGLGGHFLAPTLVTGVAANDAQEEVFGPVATVHPFESDAQALALANGSPFGLAGYVYGRDEERALGVARRVRAGSVKVNGVSLLSLHPAAPRPAWGLSGLGDEGNRETLLFFTGARVVGRAGAPD